MQVGKEVLVFYVISDKCALVGCKAGFSIVRIPTKIRVLFFRGSGLQTLEAFYFILSLGFRAKGICQQFNLFALCLP